MTTNINIQNITSVEVHDVQHLATPQGEEFLSRRIYITDDAGDVVELVLYSDKVGGLDMRGDRL